MASLSRSVGLSRPTGPAASKRRAISSPSLPSAPLRPMPGRSLRGGQQPHVRAAAPADPVAPDGLPAFVVGAWSQHRHADTVRKIRECHAEDSRTSRVMPLVPSPASRYRGGGSPTRSCLRHRSLVATKPRLHGDFGSSTAPTHSPASSLLPSHQGRLAHFADDQTCSCSNLKRNI
jgi:hypothetical protein